MKVSLKVFIPLLMAILAVSINIGLIHLIIQLNKEISLLDEEIQKIRKTYENLTASILSLNYNNYGGFIHLYGQVTGFFHIEKIDGKFWLADPDGKLFLSKGVNHVNYWSDHAPSLGYSPYNKYVSEKYGSADRWAEETVTRLRTWGFNTVGAWSSEEAYNKGMPYTVILNIAIEAGADWQTGKIVDYFSRNFEETAEKVASVICEAKRNDKYLIGYFTDNELRWAADWRSRNNLFDDYMLLPPEAEGKRALINLLKEKYHDEISSLNRVWGTTFSSFEELLSATSIPKTPAADADRNCFLRLISERYFKVTCGAIRRHDPNHLILGCRFAYMPPDEVIHGCIGYTDVVSVNCYTNPYSNDLELRLNDLRRIHELTGLPIMITEFSFKAIDSGLPNTKGAGVPVKTQMERAKYYEEYVKAMVREPFIVGYHWFQYADQPREGRFDGENSNFGLVTVRDEPWETLTQRVKMVNLMAEMVHLEG